MNKASHLRIAEKSLPAGEMNAVITGATAGIGKAIAIALAAMGGSICVVGRSKDRLDAVAELAHRKARSVLSIAGDLTANATRNELVERLSQEFEQLDVLVHCAGAYAAGGIENSPLQELDELYATNVRSPYALTQALLPLLRRRQGQIVFINSTQGLYAKANTAAFAATQHALKAMADGLRHEVNPHGVRVLSVYPGRTATPRIKALYLQQGWDYRPELLLQPEDVAQAVMNALMMPRTAEITSIELRPLIKSY